MPRRRKRTRHERLGDLIDLAITRLEKQLAPEDSTVSSSMIRELTVLAKSAGVSLDDSADALKRKGPDHVLESLSNVDLDEILGELDVSAAPKH